MNYLEFKKKIQERPVFLSQDLEMFKEDKQVLRNQIGRWQKKGLLINLKKGVYLLNKYDRKISPSRVFIANQLYSPSYISLEYALSFYGLIPERVVDVTCVTARKTQQFRNEFGLFIFRHIQKDGFTGFCVEKDEEGLPYFIASPEKAIVDFLYFNLNIFKKDFLKVFKENLRFQNTAPLKKDKILSLARLFKNKKLTDVSKEFCEFIREENR